MSAIWDLQKNHRTFGYGTNVQKAFYHPTRQRKIDPTMAKTKLSREEANRHSEESLDNYDLELMKDSNVNQPSTGTHQLDWSQDFPSFDESWPNSERPSTVEQSDYSLETTVSSAVQYMSLVDSDALIGSKKPAVEPEKTTKSDFEHESVLSKYVQRFRKAAPQSREARLKSNVADPSDFWWLQDSSFGSTSKKVDKGREGVKDLKQRSNFSNSNRLPNSEQPRRSKLDNWFDKDTQLLHFKTDSLLERAASSMSSSSHPIVSTTGLGSEPSTYSGSVIDEVSYRPQFSRVEDSSDGVSGPNALRPVDDILEQWRRRRRLDQAMERIKLVDNERDNFQPVHISSTIEAFRRRLAFNSTDVAVGMETRSSRLTSEEIGLSGKKDANVQTSFDETSHVNHVFHHSSSSLPQAHGTKSSTDLRPRVSGALKTHTDQMLNGRTYVDHPCLEKSRDLSSADTRRQIRRQVSESSLRSSSDEETTDWRSEELYKEKKKRPERVKSYRSKAQRDRGFRQIDSQKGPMQPQTSDEQKVDTLEITNQATRDVANDTEVVVTSGKPYPDTKGTSSHCKELENETILAQKELDGIDSSILSQENIERVSSESLPTAVNDLHHGGQEAELLHAERQMGSRPILTSTRSQAQSLAGGRNRRRSRNCAADDDAAAARTSSSSPSRIRNIIISQVVNNHLFDMSDSLTIISSLDNSSTNHESSRRLDSQGHHQSRDTSSPAQQQGNDDDLKSLVGSDEEEFRDDNILRDLRQRRSIFVKLLRQLDEDLEQKHAAHTAQT